MVLRLNGRGIGSLVSMLNYGSVRLSIYCQYICQYHDTLKHFSGLVFWYFCRLGNDFQITAVRTTLQCPVSERSFYIFTNCHH